MYCSLYQYIILLILPFSYLHIHANIYHMNIRISLDKFLDITTVFTTATASTAVKYYIIQCMGIFIIYSLGC